MDFIQTETYKNLALSFSAESMAGLRYQFIADKLQQEGHVTLAKVIKQIAKNETFHAKTVFELLNKYAGDRKNVVITGDFPFVGTTVEKALENAVEGELFEGDIFYPEIAQTALKEGFPEISAKLNMISKIELNHRDIFSDILKGYTTSTLYVSDKPKTFICSACGHTAKDTKAWHICPVCGNSQGYVILNELGK